MEVTEEQNTPLFVTFLDQLLRVVNGWMDDLRGRLPAAVQIAASEGAAVVSVDNTVGIEHWDNLKDEVLP